MIKINQPTEKKIPVHIYYTATGTLKNVKQTQGFILESAQVCKMLNPKVKCIEPDYCFGCFFSKPKLFKKFTYKYYQAVQRAGKDGEVIKFEKIPTTTVLSFEYVGPYSKMKKAYKFVSKWLKENNIKEEDVTGPIREVYVDGPWNKENPEEYKTELQVPIKK